EGRTMSDETFRQLIGHGDVDELRRALEVDPGLANRTIHWHLNQDNESDPLHYVSDCVGNGWLTIGVEDKIAELLLAFGAQIDGTAGRESPLIASASSGAEKVSTVLIEAGAKLEKTSIFGARALHWAAWMGSSLTVKPLIAHGAQIEAKDSEYLATPLFWAVHGFGPDGPEKKKDQVGAAMMLLEAGANARTLNNQGFSPLDLANSCKSKDMYEMLKRYVL
ncbi:MAG TPA: ankyrin repeat domain-containing protein, partial [Candidatus Acidoferrum sp.]